MRVFLIAESLRRRDMLEALLSARGIPVAGSASDLEHAEEVWPEDDSDVLLLDAGKRSGEEVFETLQEQEWLRDTSIVLMVEQTSPAWTTQALRAGLRGVLPVNAGGDLLVAALAAVGQGLVVLHPEHPVVTRTTGSTETAEISEVLESLTSREKEVLRMLAEGLANKEIAARLRISEHTVKFHVASVLGKLGAASRAEAVAIGMRRGLILL